MKDIKKLIIDDLIIDIDNIEIGEDEQGGYIYFKDKKDAEKIAPILKDLLNNVEIKETTKEADTNPYAYYRYGGSRYLGSHVQPVGMYTENTPYSIMHVFGMGDGEDNGMINAGRIIKGKRDFIMEIKAGDNLYCGIQLRGNYNSEMTGKGEIYTSTYSKIQACIENDNADIPVADDRYVYKKQCGCGE